MGSRARVTVCYGIDYGACAEGGDAARFESSDAEPVAGQTGPAELAYYGEPPDFPVCVITYGHYDYRRIVLAAAGSVREGRSWEPVELADWPDCPDSYAPLNDALRAYCETHGLTYHRPRWLAVSYYG